LLTPLPASLATLLLHSFPTRRSSDLPRRIPARVFPVASPEPAQPALDEAERLVRARSAAAVAAKVQGRPHGTFAATAAALRARTDRKSTRLNSSHVSISYAVFCLKKK